MCDQNAALDLQCNLRSQAATGAMMSLLALRMVNKVSSKHYKRHNPVSDIDALNVEMLTGHWTGVKPEK